MRRLTKIYLISLLLVGLAASACAMNLNRQLVAEPEKLSGSYTVVLVGGTFAADAERIAILDLEGDGYNFQPVTPEYRVKRVAGLTAATALAEAEKLFSPHCAYNGYRVRSLRLQDGVIVGYEAIPDYPPSLCEWGNTVTVGYKVGDSGEIKVYTNLMLPVDGGGSFDKVGGQVEKSTR
jgi:hypothetical protein